MGRYSGSRGPSELPDAAIGGIGLYTILDAPGLAENYVYCPRKSRESPDLLDILRKKPGHSGRSLFDQFSASSTVTLSSSKRALPNQGKFRLSRK